MFTRAWILAAVISVSTCVCAFSATPSLINYQGVLTDIGGTPEVGTFSVTFAIYGVPSGGSSLWSETQNVTTDNQGRFNVLLGSVTPLSDSYFSDIPRYLGTAVSPNAEMTPRVQITSVAYSQRVSTVDGASGGNITSKVSIGPGHTNTGTNTFVSGFGNQVLGNESAILGGSNNRTAGSSSAIVDGGSNDVPGDLSFIGGGVSNVVSGDYSSIVGGENGRASGNDGFLGGGANNRVRGDYCVIGGGGGSSLADSNHASGFASGVLTGARNIAKFQYSVVGGGYDNRAESEYGGIFSGQINRIEPTGGSSVIAGGGGNTVTGSNAGLLTGLSNRVDGTYSGLIAGRQNELSGAASFLGAGGYNKLRGPFSVICGGGSGNDFDSNSVTSTAAFVGGGSANRITADNAVIAGGYGNGAQNYSAGVLAGTNNVASGIRSGVVSGSLNLASGEQSIVAGGEFNEASGRYSMVPGGSSNIASGRFSLAAGRQANAGHSGTFVWADSTNASFASTAANQFLIRAGNGVGIGTNAPTAGLHITSGGSSGLILALGSSQMDIGWPTGENLQMGNWNGTTFTERLRISSGGQVSIGTTAAGNILTVQQTSATDPIADAWTTYSSRRWKEHIHTIDHPLDLVARLRGVRYDWKANGQHDIGLIAEEVGEVIPEIVAYEENGIDAKSVDYARLVAVLIEGMKAQQKEIESLQKRLDQMTP